jgi:hypothetical protein
MGKVSTNVAKRPPCDMCLRPAYADARLKKGPEAGRWAYVCREHFDEYGCEVGTGHGQVLKVVSR